MTARRPSTRPVVPGLFLALVAPVLAPASVFAEEVVLLPHGGDDTLTVERAAAQGAVRNAIGEQGMHLVEPNASSDERLAQCATIDCAPALLRDLEVDLAIAVAVWREQDGADETRVYVTVVDPAGSRYPAFAKIEGADIAAAARAAFLDARALELLGAGPWIHVRGMPEGADVLVDGVRVGTLPYRDRIGVGRHRLEVRHAGMLTDARDIDIPPSPTRTVDVKIVLTRAAAAAGECAGGERDEGGVCLDASYAGDDVRHPIVGPVILGAVGLSLGALVVADLLADDCTRTEPTGTCTRRERPNVPLAIGLGAAGAAAIAGAIVWYVVGAEPAVPESSAGLRLRPTGVTARF